MHDQRFDEARSRASLEAVFRAESARLIGGLVRVVRDLDLAEDLAQEALVAALETWPTQGVPDNPGAWLMTAAKHRGLDRLRHRELATRKHALLAEPHAFVPELEAALDDEVGDDLLRLVLIACHPALSTEGRTALTLRLLGGLTTDEIASAFLVPEPTIAQRIVRAKRTLAEARAPFEVPRGEELRARLPSVLEVLYLIFNEGYAATRGDHWTRSELCETAMRLARTLIALVPHEPEAHGLLALMELHASRMDARVDASGDPVLLTDQDRTRWDASLIRRGLESLARAEAVPAGPYALQAAIVACHARAASVAETDWVRIVELYDALLERTGSPIVELNRAVAIGMAHGPEAGLASLAPLLEEPTLRAYHLLGAVHGDLLAKAGRYDEARLALERAASLTPNARERALLGERAKACRPPI